MTNLQPILSQRLTDAVSRPLPLLTRRDVRLPAVPGKAIAVVGVRRAGKTSFLWQGLADLAAAGAPRESLVLLGFEDDRLDGITTADLDWLLEEYFRRFPAFRGGAQRATICLDEIQEVPGWERFARRVIDTEPTVSLRLSGSSAKLLSREVATSLRGRGIEVLVHPFSFREALRHAGAEPQDVWDSLDNAAQSDIDARLRNYLQRGGFPEAQGADLIDSDRARLLSGYVDTVVLRDVIERHNVSNPTALRALQLQLLGNPAGAFSITKTWNDIRSRGIAVGKDSMYAFLSHLEDAFLVRTVSVLSRSERKQWVNPRKVYPIDPALIALFAMPATSHVGHALETVVLLELERRSYAVHYLLTEERYEVDFHAYRPGEQPLLIQVCADVSAPATLEREVRALLSARATVADARLVLVTLNAAPPPIGIPPGIEWYPAARWLLEDA